MSDLLDRLAEACGIAPRWVDIWGKWHDVEPEAKRALLGSMGVDVASDESMQAALTGFEEGPWRRPLEPVQVVHEPLSGIEIPVRLPASDNGRSFRWLIRFEDGTALQGEFRPDELRPTGTRGIDGREIVARVLAIDHRPPAGYHHLRIEPVDGPGPTAAMPLIVAPARCYVPEGLQGEGRVWGPAVQLYALRSSRNWGIGDFGDLRTLVDTLADHGAGIIGLNPLHALFPDDPSQFSPYGPSSRSFLNYLYVDVEAVPELADCPSVREEVTQPDFQARLLALRQNELVDYERVAAVKRPILERLYDHFRDHHLAHDTPRGRAFRAFCEHRGTLLEGLGIFEALQGHFRGQDESIWGWPVWPEEYRRPESPAVRGFAEERRDRVEFFQYLQWLCDEQLGAVGRRCHERGLRVGLYQDLAVGVSPTGFEGWWFQDLFALDARVGAPPDDFNLKGQEWGLPPWIPWRLREAGYEPFVQCLRANMVHSGALRLDHVMGLMRVFCVPPGKTGAEGSYLHYRFDDLLGILALESQRNRCLVIGEDLGTVPDEVRAGLGPLGVLSYRLFYFMKRSDGNFTRPEDYPRQALVAISTHDLPTLAGWWTGRDLSLREELGLFPEEQLHERQLVGRAEDRTRVLLALRSEGLLPEDVEVDLGAFPELTAEVVTALHVYLARSPSRVMTIQLEDVLGQEEQVNLPGTIDEHPNWRRKLPATLAQIAADPRLERLGRELCRVRGEGSVRREEPGEAATAGPPTATYRLQFNRDFRLADAERLVPYLRRLGISHVYASPLLKARPGSTHGYDIIDHASLNPEIGTAEEFDRLIATLRGHAMGLVVDVVPNHMGVGSDNAWWMSVLEHGRASPWADFFDIDWHPGKEALRGKLLLPILEDQYGAVLDRGLLRLQFDERAGELWVAYHEHRLPLDPATYPIVLGYAVERLEARLGADDEHYPRYRSLLTALENLPGRGETGAERVEARLRDCGVHKIQLSRLYAESEGVRALIRENVALANDVEARPDGGALLDRLMGRQAFRPAFWRTAADEINYRRFFDINDLAGVRVENSRVFEQTHALVFDLVAQRKLDGLRLDHPDGLHDPAEYYRRLREAWGDRREPWIVTEKILAAHERLPRDWAVDGTTGYEFCNQVNGLWVDAAAEKAMDRVYTRFVGRRLDFDELLYANKKLIATTALSSELTVLSDMLDRISEADRHTRDFTRQQLRSALIEVIARFPVYRTYVAQRGASEEDRRYVEWAVAQASKAGKVVETSTFDFIRDVLTLDAATGRDEGYRESVLRFAMKFQQTTGPVTAKALEDTTFYIYNRLLSLNEVGGDPRRFGLSVSAFHHVNADRAEHWPRAMLNTSTHDSKRSEDVRARISALSELPERWQKAVSRWTLLNRSRKRMVEQRLAPSKNDEYALYQTLVGVWPNGQVDESALRKVAERVKEYAIKAVREAKVHSSWINPDPAYEAAVGSFIEALLDLSEKNPFLAEFLPLQRYVARLGMLNGLSQALLKATVPGVPDVYQGCEAWALTLVDPDNRRPVDFARLQSMLDGLEGGKVDAAALLRDAEEDRVKMWVTRCALRCRRDAPGLFADGDYIPLQTVGERADHVVAFARTHGERMAVVVVPRLVARLCDVEGGEFPLGERTWNDTGVVVPALAAGACWSNLLTGERIAAATSEGSAELKAADLFRSLPLALLVPELPTDASGSIMGA